MKKYIFAAGGIALGAVICALLFRESFSGLVLQGVDDNISVRMMMLRSLESAQGYHLFPVYWLGYIFNVPNPDLTTTVLALTKSAAVVGVYVLAVLLSMGLTYAFLRRLSLAKDASLFGALGYSFLPHVLSLVYSGHAPAISAIPMTPGFLLALTVLIREEKPLVKGFSALWAGIFWSQMVLGEPQRAAYGTVLGAAWVLCLLLERGTFAPKAPFVKKEFWVKLLPYFAGAALVGAAIYYPAFRFWSSSEFAAQEGSWEFSTSWSFPPAELINSLAFGYHGIASGDPAAPYWGDKPLAGNTDSLGFFLLVFTVIGAALLWKNKAKRGYLFFFLGAGLIALLLSFGKYFPGTPFFWLWYHLPGMNKVRVPAKFLSITGLCWAAVAAMGFQALRELWESADKTLEKTKRITLYCLGGALGLSIIWASLLLLTGGGDAAAVRAVLGRNRALVDAALTLRLGSVINMALLFLGLALAALAAHRKWIRPSWAGWIIILLSAWNLYASNRVYVAKTYVKEAEFYPRTPLIDYLSSTQSPLYRISGSLFIPNIQKNPEWPIGAVAENQLYALNNYDLTYAFPYYDINSFGRIPVSRLDAGYKTFFQAPVDSVPQYAQNSDIWEMNKRLWFMGNVDRILVGPEMAAAFAAELERDAELLTNLQAVQGTVAVYKLKLAFPRFALVKGVKKASEPYPVAAMAQNLQNLGLYQPVAEDNGSLLQSADTTVYTPQVLRTGFNSYEVTLSSGTESPSFFVFGDLYDEGWKASVDGAPAAITRVNAVQQGFSVPAGAKGIEIGFEKPVLGLGVARAIIALGLLAAAVLGILSLTGARGLKKDTP